MNTSPTNSRLRLSLLPLAALGVAIDQWTKHWARQELVDRPLFIGDTKIGFSLTFNSGSAFSLFESATLLLTILGTGIFVAISVAAFRATHLWPKLGYGLIAAGALGNLLDRYFRPPSVGRGYVTDFIKVYSWPTFNIADSMITVGVIFLIISMVFPQINQMHHKNKSDNHEQS